MKIAGLLLVALLLAGAAWVRLAPSDPARWHVDPQTAPDPDRPSFARLDPGQIIAPRPAPDLAARVQAAMLALPRTRLLAGSAAQGHMTFITRSAVWGFPDYTSIRVLPTRDGATLAAFARARFGHSDLGVNAARLDILRRALAPPR